MPHIRTILLVEDSDHEAELALRALRDPQDPSLEVILARHGMEALDYLFCRGTFENRKAVDPALVILDLNLPESSGVEVLKQIKKHERLRSVPVVIFTSSEQETVLQACYFLGVNAYVLKPGAYKEFSAALKAIKQFWLNYNARPTLSAATDVTTPEVKPHIPSKPNASN